MVGDILGGLFGEEEQPGVQRSGLSELLNIFPELQGVGQDVISRGVGLAGQADPFAPPSLTAGQQQALQTLGGVTPFTPQGQFRPQFGFGQRASEAFQGARDLFGQVDPALQQAGQRISAGVDPITGQEIQTGISQFFNPFEEQVVSNVAREAQEAGSTALSQLAGRATAAGGFGGTRQALIESQVPGIVAQQVGDVSANLRRAGFESAAGRALQNLQFGRSQQLQGAGLGIQQAGQFAGAGAQLGGLGQQLFGARQGVQGIQSQQISDALRLAQGQLQAGQLPREISQQQAQIPLQQLQLLQGLISGFPSGGTQVGGTQATGGLLSGGGNVLGGIGTLSGLGSSGGTLGGFGSGLGSFFGF